MGGRWLFPAVVVLAMAACNCTFGVIAASINAVEAYFPEQTAFMINFLTFNYYWLFLVIGPFVPWINRTVSRGAMLLTCVFLMLVGTAVESAYTWGFNWVLVGTIISNLPQPVLVASIADILAEYTPEEHESLCLGMYITIQNIAAGLSYLFAVWWLSSAPQLQQNWLTFDLVAVGMLMVAFLGCVLYILVELQESGVCLSDAGAGHRLRLPPLTRVPHRPRREDVYDLSKELLIARAIYWAFLVSYACQNALGNVFGLLFDQVASDDQLSPLQVTVTVLLIGLLGVPTPTLVGVVADRAQSWHLLPWLLVAAQTLFQIGIFYWAPTSLAFIVWVVLFAVINSSLTTVFLPALLRIQTEYSRSVTNAAMAWATTLLTALGNLIALGSAQGLVQQMAPVFLALGVAATAASLIALLASKTKPIQ